METLKKVIASPASESIITKNDIKQYISEII